MAKKSSKDHCEAMPMVEKSWRAREDADTLRRAGEIMGDKGRVKAAQSELQKNMEAIRRVAGGEKAPRPRSSSLGFARGRR